jgi:SAM-dependent methyltransferase
VAWSLDHAYDVYPRIEEDFQALLDESLDPRGPDILFDVVAGFGLPSGSVAVDVLADRFGFSVIGIDPVARHIEVARASAPPAGPTFARGGADQIPVGDSTVDLIWCRDVLVHVPDLAAVYVEFRRVLRPGGRVVVYQMFGTDLLEAREATWLWDVMGVIASNADPANTDDAIVAAGLRIDRCIQLGTEWGEWAQEHNGKGGRKLLHASRLIRGRDAYLERYGRASYDLMLGDCLWHIYAMIGKLTRRVYLLSSPTAA